MPMTRVQAETEAADIKRERAVVEAAYCRQMNWLVARERKLQRECPHIHDIVRSKKKLMRPGVCVTCGHDALFSCG